VVLSIVKVLFHLEADPSKERYNSFCRQVFPAQIKELVKLISIFNVMRIPANSGRDGPQQNI
jgi:hypothetical protein